MQFTRKKFIAKVDQQKKYAGGIGRVGSVILFLVLGVSIVAAKKIQIISEYRIFFGSLFLMVLLLTAGITIWLMFNNMRKIGLVCPYCGKLLDIHFSETALNTSKCKRCGEVIINIGENTH